jgi:hypothetical protein
MGVYNELKILQSLIRSLSQVFILRCEYACWYSKQLVENVEVHYLQIWEYFRAFKYLYRTLRSMNAAFPC